MQSIPDCFLQRSLAPTEYELNIHGQTVVPVGVKARLQNEAACLRFIKSATNIPVPEVVAEYEQDKSYFLWTATCDGIQMSKISVTDQETIPSSPHYEHFDQNTMVDPQTLFVLYLELSRIFRRINNGLRYRHRTRTMFSATTISNNPISLLIKILSRCPESSTWIALAIAQVTSKAPTVKALCLQGGK
jgi:hypothetical protein